MIQQHQLRLKPLLTSNIIFVKLYSRELTIKTIQFFFAEISACWYIDFIHRGSAALKVNGKFLVSETMANIGFRKMTKPA